MTKVGGYIFDIDGTLAVMEQKSKSYVALPGAVEALRRIQSVGLGAMAQTNGTCTDAILYFTYCNL